jgi:hypothetical protein
MSCYVKLGHVRIFSVMLFQVRSCYVKLGQVRFG